MEKEKAIGILQAVKAGTADAFIRKAVIKDALDVAISALEKQEQTRWIPVTERLPEKDDFVLVTISGTTSNGKSWEHTMTLAVWTGDSWDLVDADMHDFRIFAWRPLPEPYVPEEIVEDVWHPASEDPPKKYSHYWVQLCDSNGNYVGMHDCVWTDSGFFSQYKTDWHWVGNPQYTKIVAWRPLPERFIGEENGCK